MSQQRRGCDVLQTKQDDDVFAVFVTDGNTLEQAAKQDEYVTIQANQLLDLDSWR